MSVSPAPPSLGVRIVAVILTACGLNALVQVPHFIPGWGSDPLLLSGLQALCATAGLSAGIAAWRGRAWAWIPALLYGVITGAMIAALGPLLDLDAGARAALPMSGAVMVLVASAMAWYLWRALGPARTSPAPSEQTTAVEGSPLGDHHSR